MRLVVRNSAIEKTEPFGGAERRRKEIVSTLFHDCVFVGPFHHSMKDILSTKEQKS
jgi:hypothetical protein